MKMSHDKVDTYADGRVVYSKVCSVTGDTYKVEVEQSRVYDWQAGAFIQNAMPNLTAEQREFVRIGLTPAEFDKIHGSMSDPDTENL